METDREVLLFLHDRFVHVYKENELVDYLHRFRAIIAKTPKDKYTPTACLNGMDDLLRLFERLSRKPKRKPQRKVK